jgi:CGNR zinc finger/Putative stress-induced transcription regulator
MDVERLLAFLNTLDVEAGTDELGDDFACARWLRDHGLPATGVEATTAREIREALRAAIDGAALPMPAIPVSVVLDEGSPGLVSTHPLGSLLVTAARLAVEDRWPRIKLCDCHTCRYAFYDASRNRSAKWCSMRVCGNREKTRAFRSRARETADT